MTGFKERYERIKNSPEFKRRRYVARIRAILIIPFIVAAIIATYIAEKFLGISEYTAGAFTGFMAVVLASLIAEKAADKIFGSINPSKDSEGQ